ncbi:hypothetical protein LINPERPRIM_LOCUS36919, partial [Linum perenne]
MSTLMRWVVNQKRLLIRKMDWKDLVKTLKDLTKGLMIQSVLKCQCILIPLQGLNLLPQITVVMMLQGKEVMRIFLSLKWRKPAWSGPKSINE